MPDSITPVGAMIQPVDPMKGINTFSGILGLQQQRQGLQQGQQAIALKQQELQRSLLETQQAQGVNNFFGSWSPGDHYGDDGTIDINSAHNSPQYKSLSGVARYAVDAKLNDLRTQQLSAKQALVTLNGDVLNQGAKTLQTMSEAAPEDRPALITAFRQQGPDNARFADIFQQFLSKVPPERQSQALKSAAAAAVDVSAQQPKVTPVSRGGTTDIYNVIPAKGMQPGQQPVASVPNTIPPGWQMTEDPVTHNKYMVNQQTGQTRPLGQPFSGGAGPAPAPGAPTTNAPPQRLPGQGEAQADAALAVTKRVQQAQAAANNTVQTQDALSRVVNIMSGPHPPTTGPGFDTKTWGKTTLAGLGIDTGATNANELIKNIARYEGARATQAGLGGTDAARDLSNHGSPNTQVDDSALLNIARQSLATEKALGAYAKIQTGVQDPNQLAKNENTFRNIPHLIETYEYAMQRNQREAEAYLKEHGMTHQSVTQSVKALKDLGAM